MMKSKWLLIAMTIAVPGFGQEHGLDHRDDFQMSFISGGTLRAYVSEVVTEDHPWAQSMHTLGTFHNFMHEVMSDLARHDAAEAGHRDRVPEFEERISGGDWTDYREMLAQAGAMGAWADLVQIAEIMHDRVHHAMYKAVVYDHISQQRTVDLTDYMDEAPAPTAETIPASEKVNYEYVSSGDFRQFVWHTSFKGAHLHGAMQSMQVFDHLLTDLMWADHGATMAEEACRPPAFKGRISSAAWGEYVQRVSSCGDEHWRELVVVTGLMHDRVHHMMHQAVAYYEKLGAEEP